MFFHERPSWSITLFYWLRCQCYNNATGIECSIVKKFCGVAGYSFLGVQIEDLAFGNIYAAMSFSHVVKTFSRNFPYHSITVFMYFWWLIKRTKSPIKFSYEIALWFWPNKLFHRNYFQWNCPWFMHRDKKSSYKMLENNDKTLFQDMISPIELSSSTDHCLQILRSRPKGINMISGRPKPFVVRDTTTWKYIRRIWTFRAKALLPSFSSVRPHSKVPVRP